MGFEATKWTEGDYIPREHLIAWHSADTATDGQTVEDASGNDRHLDTGFGSTPPVLTPNYINGVAAIEFDGSTHDPLLWNTAIPAVRHAIVIAGHEDAQFPAGDLGNGGLLTGVTTGNCLVGNASSTRFFDFDQELLGTFGYRRRGRSYAENNMQGSFSGQISVFDIKLSTGFFSDGICVGRQRDIAARLWKGPWCEHLLYSAIKTEEEMKRIFTYIALKYQLWQQNDSGVDIWPFQPDWGRPLTHDKLVLSSTTVSGKRKSRSKSPMKKGFEAGFTDREPEEIDAAVEFWDQKYPGTSFIYRDEAFTPARDTSVKFTGTIVTPARGYREMDYAIQVVED